MAAFLLPNVPPNLLTRIISQFEWKSYFRLQQTCKEMEEFIRTNRNIKGVLVDKFAEMKWRKREGATVQLNWREGKPIEHLYGIRFSYLKPPPEISNFEDLCDILKKHRITAAELPMLPVCYRNGFPDPFIKYTKGQCLLLFNILKPTKVSLNSVGSDRFEPLIPLKQLDEVYINVDPDSVLFAMKEFLPRLKLLHIKARATSEDIYNLLNPGLQLLLSLFPLPNLQSFEFRLERDSSARPHNEVMQKLYDFNPLGTRYNSNTENSSVKCTLDSDGFCNVWMDNRIAAILFQTSAYREKTRYRQLQFVLQ